MTFNEINKLVVKGRNHYKNQEYNQGLPYFEEVLKIKPDHVYSLQCVSQYYLNTDNYEKAKPICLKLLKIGKLSSLSTRRFESLAASHNESFFEQILNQLIMLRLYSKIQRMCRGCKDREKEALLQIKKETEAKEEKLSYEWYNYMINNRIYKMPETDKEVWFYLTEARAFIKTYDEFDNYAVSFKLYVMSLKDLSIYPDLIIETKTLLNRNPFCYYLLEALLFMRKKLEEYDQCDDLISQLLLAYEKDIEKPYNQRENRAIKHKISLIEAHTKLSCSIGQPAKYAHQYKRLLEDQKVFREFRKQRGF